MLSWGNANRYASFFFNFRQTIDWDYLSTHGYAITFKAKADKPARFDIRFIDRENASGIPWRMNTTVSVEADGEWHSLRIPLASMREQGAWLSATRQWLTPHGQFSWANVDRLAFVAEDGDLHGVTILFDVIKIE